MIYTDRMDGRDALHGGERVRSMKFLHAGGPPYTLAAFHGNTHCNAMGRVHALRDITGKRATNDAGRLKSPP